MNEERSAESDIAVVGIACRFPGADGPEANRAALRDGVDAGVAAPPGRPPPPPPPRAGR
ncbi:beta-ketoacyl synthase N-terminal-like domain-containing protein, partial [Streptomyces sp. NPDC059627]